MNQCKRCAALLLALVMVCAMAIPARAAETDGSITVNGTKVGEIYKIYKIFDLTLSNAGAVAYTIDAEWEAFFANGGKDYLVDENPEGASLSPITVDGVTRYINITDTNVAQFAQTALPYAVGLTEDAKQEAADTTVLFENLALGYYLVYPQGASEIKDAYLSLCSLTSTVPDAVVNVKADYPTIEKTDDAVSVDVGQIVTYTVTGQVPDTTGYEHYEYTVKDTMTDGLTFRKDVTVTFGATPVEVSPVYTDNGFTLTFDMTAYQTYKGQEITITYSAQVNENAVQVGTVEKNSAILIYSHDPSDSTIIRENPPVEEKVYTSQILIDKIDGASDEEDPIRLAGAEFVLMDQGNKYYKLENGVVSWVESQEAATKVTTDENGAAAFDGLADGIYFLKEIKAPDGYNLLPDPVKVDVNSEGTNTVSVSVTAVVENNSGATLPETGGMGTTALYGFGGVLVLTALVLLITKKRVRNV